MSRVVPVLALVLAPALSAVPARANDFQPVTELPTFLSVIEGRALSLGLFGVSINVMPDGRIDGRASGYPISGSWTWQDGFFCREMDWGGTPIPYNCQLVEVRGDDVIRFTVDQGAGESAQFNLR